MGLFKVLIRRLTGALVVRVCHTIQPVFDDPNLIAFGGLPAVMRIAEQAGLYELVAQHLTVPGAAGANATIKVPALVAGMVAGADSISDMDVLRHGGMGRMFDGLRAATTLGTHLRGYRFGHVRQLDAVASRLLVKLARLSPILDGADQICFVDVDDTIPAITAGGARFSITARMNKAVTKTIATISDTAWTTIRCPQAIWDEAQQVWISDAEVAEVPHTALTSRRQADHVTARLIVRRVRRLNPNAKTQPELLPATATTPSSPTAPSAWSKPRPATATTPSSRQSSPTSKTGRSRTHHRGSSPPTVPGSSSPRSRSTSPAPPPGSPPKRSAAPGPRPCAAPWSAWPPGSRTKPAPGYSTYPGTGRGNTNSAGCTTPRSAHQQPPSPDPPPPQARARNPSGKAGHTGRHTTPSRGIAARPIPEMQKRSPTNERRRIEAQLIRMLARTCQTWLRS